MIRVLLFLASGIATGLLAALGHRWMRRRRLARQGYRYPTSREVLRGATAEGHEYPTADVPYGICTTPAIHGRPDAVIEQLLDQVLQPRRSER